MAEEFNPEIRAFYEERLASEKDTARQVGWRDQHAQFLRFRQLARVIQRQPCSLNDFGCGTGDLYGFLAKEGYQLTYHGYDVLPGMILEAKRIWGDGPQRGFNLVQQPDEMSPADYTVVSGTFNVKGGTSDNAWKSIVLDHLRLMNARSKLGFAFNLLTSYSDPPLMRPELYYADPLFYFDFCKRNYSKDVALLHDYGLYDFTILVRKVVL